MTQYSIVAPDDYKRCVCAEKGNGASDCPQSNSPTPNPTPDPTPDPDPTPTPDPDPTPTPDPDPTPTPDPAPQPDPVWLTQQTLQQIRDNPNFSSDRPSMTVYQVDRDIKLMQVKFEELHDAVVAKGLI